MTPEEVDQLDTLQELRDRVAQMQQAIKDIEGWFAAKYAVDVQILGDNDEPVAVFEQAMKFDAGKAEEVLSVVPALLALVQVSEPKIMAAKAKKLLPPETYAKCQIPNGQPKLKFLGGGE